MEREVANTFIVVANCLGRGAIVEIEAHGGRLNIHVNFNRPPYPGAHPWHMTPGKSRVVGLEPSVLADLFPGSRLGVTPLSRATFANRLPRSVHAHFAGPTYTVAPASLARVLWFDPGIIEGRVYHDDSEDVCRVDLVTRAN